MTMMLQIVNLILQASFKSEPVQRQYMKQLQVECDAFMQRVVLLRTKLRENPPETVEECQRLCRRWLPTHLCHGPPIYAPPSQQPL